MSDAATEIQAAALKRAKAEDAFKRADAELRDLLVKWRAEGEGPSDMARWSGFTREWVAKIAPNPNASRQAAVKRRLERLNADDD
ncbi:hypothetical protein [Streptomyces sp. 4R-3d]|uniref:hypothetical protein n=1 Tax=Streptomyces sp. 4R-3d TaxID=2559605 RepID=UPI0010720DC4|nr:hypothetical protein [Streptomyces sp. 4R-3d]TFI30104.1 hypothetical protein E4P36_04970 [Streptomyces sp. 4R-3d]